MLLSVLLLIKNSYIYSWTTRKRPPEMSSLGGRLREPRPYMGQNIALLA